MSDHIDDGGAAFAHGNPEQGSDAGMSLRDWFAGQALAAVIMSTSAGMHDAISDKPHSTTIIEALAIDAYRLADAMLSARKGGQ